MNPKALLKFMWEQYYYIPSTKTMIKNPPSANSKVLFVSLIMEPLVERYNQFFTPEVLVSTAQIKDAHSTIKEKFSKLFPMEHGILKMVVDHLPCPLEAQKDRLRVFCPFLTQPDLPEKYTQIKSSIEQCKSDLYLKQEEEVPPTVVYVTKMQPFSARLYDITTRAEKKSTDT